MQVYSTQHGYKLSLSEAARLLLMMYYESPPHASMAFCEADWNSQRSLLEKEVNSKTGEITQLAGGKRGTAVKK